MCASISSSAGSGSGTRPASPAASCFAGDSTDCEAPAVSLQGGARGGARRRRAAGHGGV
jgi:hypothetical protein